MLRMVLVALALAGCAEEAVSVSSSNNPNVPVSLLFEHDGCRVYRFKDAGRFHYYVTCAGRAERTQSEWFEYCGKKCSRTVRDEIPTSEGGAHDAR
jgi:hypothetical protein